MAMRSSLKTPFSQLCLDEIHEAAGRNDNDSQMSQTRRHRWTLGLHYPNAAHFIHWVVRWKNSRDCSEHLETTKSLLCPALRPPCYAWHLAESSISNEKVDNWALTTCQSNTSQFQPNSMCDVLLVRVNISHIVSDTVTGLFYKCVEFSHFSPPKECPWSCSSVWEEAEKMKSVITLYHTNGLSINNDK